MVCYFSFATILSTDKKFNKMNLIRFDQVLTLSDIQLQWWSAARPTSERSIFTFLADFGAPFWKFSGKILRKFWGKKSSRSFVFYWAITLRIKAKKRWTVYPLKRLWTKNSTWTIDWRLDQKYRKILWNRTIREKFYGTRIAENLRFRRPKFGRKFKRAIGCFTFGFPVICSIRRFTKRICIK